MWLIDQLGLSIAEAADQLGIGRGTIDNWKSRDNAAPGIKVILILTKLARGAGYPIDVEWFYDEEPPMFPATIREHRAPYSDSGEAEAVRVAGSLAMVIKSISVIIQSSSPQSKNEIEPLRAYAIRELQSLKLSNTISEKSLVALENAIGILESGSKSE